MSQTVLTDLIRNAPDFRGLPVLVLDAEIKRMVPNRAEPTDPTLEYCKGWGDKLGMGISVCAVHDFQEDQSHVFLDDNARDLKALLKDRELLVTFNGWSFDEALIDECWNIRFKESIGAHLDLYAAVRHVLKKSQRHQRGYNLDALLQANGIPLKPGSSALAPADYQRGRVGLVIDKCIGDVHRTALLLRRAAAGPLEDPHGGAPIDISHYIAAHPILNHE